MDLLNIFAVAIFGGLGIFCRLRKAKVAKWLETEASVLESIGTRTISSKDDDVTYYKYKISYSANGALIENEIEGENKYSIGAVIKIKYDPSSPEKYEESRIYAAYDHASIFVFIIAALFLCYGIFKLIAG